ncbi:MAG: amidohydrolase family protein [Cyclobacteriaceae bacterium]|nr:amidohydrolase family protein [Cyclobacteriaceae bacterium]
MKKKKSWMVRRDFLGRMGLAAAGTFLLGGIKRQAAQAKDIDKDFPAIKKIDLHTHISSDATYLREVMDRLNLKMVTICNEGLKPDRLAAQIKIAREIHQKAPRYYAWCTTFDLNGFGLAGWTDRVLAGLQDDFNRGALGVKVWKEIGMQLKDDHGNFIQVDDPRFHPVFEFIEKENKTLFMHIGDPPSYWQSYGPDGRPDAWYREGRGVWNRIGEFKGEVSWETLMKARDQVLERFPGLRVIGCHLGSMAHDVSMLAKRLDHYDSFAVETSYTMRELAGQPPEKVREFFLKYQDRIMYGSDISGGLVGTPFLVDMAKIRERWTAEEVEQLKTDLIDQYHREFDYFSTDREQNFGDFSLPCLNLPDQVLEKIFYRNAVRCLPGVDHNFP